MPARRQFFQMIDRPSRIEGFAIISANGMIADAAGEFPDAIRCDADFAFFHDSLSRMDTCIHGRGSHEGGPDAATRRRIVVTRRVTALAPDTEFPQALCWNPAGASFEAAWTELGGGRGTLAVIGGTDIFGMFLKIGYDAFHLTRVPGTDVPDGRPVFPGIPCVSPEDLLAAAGLVPAESRVLEPARNVTVTTWVPRP